MGILEKAKDVYPPKDQAFYKELMDGFFEIQDGIVAGQITPEDGAKRMQQKSVEWQQRTGKKTTLD
jgi:raffinose/stachyose/melibiose transport system substrate-binding protein